MGGHRRPESLDEGSGPGTGPARRGTRRQGADAARELREPSAVAAHAGDRRRQRASRPAARDRGAPRGLPGRERGRVDGPRVSLRRVSVAGPGLRGRDRRGPTAAVEVARLPGRRSHRARRRRGRVRVGVARQADARDRADRSEREAGRAADQRPARNRRRERQAHDRHQRAEGGRVGARAGHRGREDDAEHERRREGQGLLDTEADRRCGGGARRARRFRRRDGEQPDVSAVLVAGRYLDRPLRPARARPARRTRCSTGRRSVNTRRARRSRSCRRSR